MDKYIIRGGVPLHGSVRIGGAKNAILPILAAVLLNCGESRLIDVPVLRDVNIMTAILRDLGATTELETDPATGVNLLHVDTSKVNSFVVPEDLMREMRSSIVLMGALLGRFHRARVSFPGGCSIGPRPIDLHLKGLRAMGVRFTEAHGYIDAEAQKLRGADIHLDFPSVGATENLMMAAVLAEGVTVIHNAAKEPEITDLQNYLNSMGATVRGSGTDVVRIEGGNSLHAVEHSIIPDRIETGTFMIAAAITSGDITLENIIPEHVEAVMAKLREIGVEIREEKDRVRVIGGRPIKAVDFKTMPYPGFPTDMQAQSMALMTLCDGISVITENIFENRFKQADELRRMGADIRIQGRSAIIRGVNRLTGAVVETTDLRAGAALVLAALAAEGTSRIENIYHIDRGYNRFETKLQALGAAIERV
ncbi:MAG: UDP-N-acetylglucosamine 1-carboxyvinyltransferase [bacterium]